MSLVAEVSRRADQVRERISLAGGDPDLVRLVAVTKGFGSEVVDAALGAGLLDVAESYAQELVGKAAARTPDASDPCPRWHFIGRLQSNKIPPLVPIVELWQSVDRREVVRRLAKRAPSARVLVQVDVSGVPGRGGCAPAEVAGLVAEARGDGLKVAGLMAVGPAGPPEESRPAFRALTELADNLGLVERSMGMSADLEVAIEEGSTMVRVGHALFGPRPARHRDGHPVPVGRN